MSGFKLSGMKDGNWTRIDPIIPNRHLEPEGAVIRSINTQPQTNRHFYTENTTSTSKKENDGLSYPPPPSVCPSWFLFYFLLLLLLRRQSIVITLKRELTTVLAQRRQLCALDATPCSTRSSPVTLLRKREATVCGGARRTCCWRRRSAYPHFSEIVFCHENTVAKRWDDHIHFTPIYFVDLFIKWVFHIDF